MSQTALSNVTMLMVAVLSSHDEKDDMMVRDFSTIFLGEDIT